MPTKTGLPKPGEVWERRFKLPPDYREQRIRFKVVERGTGGYWSLRVDVIAADVDGPFDFKRNHRQLWVDASYWWSQGELTFCEEPKGLCTDASIYVKPGERWL